MRRLLDEDIAKRWAELLYECAVTHGAPNFAWAMAERGLSPQPVRVAATEWRDDEFEPPAFADALDTFAQQVADAIEAARCSAGDRTSVPEGPYIVTHRPSGAEADFEHEQRVRAHEKATGPIVGGEPAADVIRAEMPREPLSRWAYATLEETWPAVVGPICTDSGSGVRTAASTYTWSNLRLEFEALPASGGTIKLPGSEIVFERTTWGRFATDISDAAVDRLATDAFPLRRTSVLAAWNAEYGIAHEGIER